MDAFKMSQDSAEILDYEEKRVWKGMKGGSIGFSCIIQYYT
jgi:hypothetical protein